MPAQPGQMLSHYRLIEKIGEGGMGVVWKAEDTRLDREVAIKVLIETLARDPERRARFEREVKAVAKLAHPNILEIWDFGTDQGVLYAVTELLDGETLSERLERGPFPWRQAAEIGAAVAGGLASSHLAGVIHRDVKPSNIFLNSDGRVKILDFGLARHESTTVAGDKTDAPTRTRHTDPGTVLGTVGYMSPEQVRGDPADHRSDIFSLGCVLYEMVSGKRTFARDTSAETMTAILKEEPTQLSATALALPPDLERTILRCLEKNPGKRFQSAQDLSFTLRSLSSGPSRAMPGVEEAENGASPPSIAVLPFTNLSADPEQEYFCDGMAEELIDGLTKLGGLRVAARTSAFQFKGQGYDIGQVGRKLKVSTVLEGSVRKAGNRVRITAQLVKVADGYHLWSDKYDRNLDDIFAIQDEISLAIVDKLRVELLGDEPRRLIKHFTEDQEAYNLYLKGRYFWNKRYEIGLKKANEFFQRACEKDASYALPYVGVADVYNILGWFGFLPPAEAFSKARAAARRALAIDPLLGEAHTSLAWVLACHDWDWSGSEEEYRRAIELNPTYATAHEWYALLLSALGRMDEAGREIERALELDPLSLIINAVAGVIDSFADESDRAIRRLQKTLELDPSFSLTPTWLAMVYGPLGRHEEAVAAAEMAEAHSEEMQYMLGLLGWVYALGGLRGRARGVLRRLDALAEKRYVSPYQKSAVYAGLGEINRALDFLEQAVELRDPILIFSHHFHQYDSVRRHPRYLAAIEKIGLP